MQNEHKLINDIKTNESFVEKLPKNSLTIIFKTLFTMKFN